MVAGRVTELVLFLWVTLISLIKNCIPDLWFLVLITMWRRWCWNGNRRRRIWMHTFVSSQFCFWVWLFLFTFFFSSFWICCSSQICSIKLVPLLKKFISMQIWYSNPRTRRDEVSGYRVERMNLMVFSFFF